MIWNKTTDKLPELTGKSYDACEYEVKRSELVLVKFDGKIMTGYYCGEDMREVQHGQKDFRRDLRGTVDMVR